MTVTERIMAETVVGTGNATALHGRTLNDHDSV